MSKPLLLLSAGVIGTGISATGAYALGAFKGNSGSKLSPPLTSSMPEELNDFTTDLKKYGCIGDKNMFQGLNVSEDISGSSEISGGFLDNSKGTNGCLLVNGNKRVSSANDGKGSVNFRLLWAVGYEDQGVGKGFIVFAIATSTNDSEKKLAGKGVAYAVEKQSSQPNGKVVQKKDVSENKKMDKDSLADKFPKADSAIHNGGEFWGLMDNSEGLNNLCETTTCTNDKSSFEGYWEGKGDANGSQALGSGTTGLKNWWKELYDDSNWDMEKVVNEIKGKGMQKLPKK